MKILPVTLDDAEELLAVYAPYVTKTAVSGLFFNSSLLTPHSSLSFMTEIPKILTISS